MKAAAICAGADSTPTMVDRSRMYLKSTPGQLLRNSLSAGLIALLCGAALGASSPTPQSSENQVPAFFDGARTTRSIAENAAAGDVVGLSVAAANPDGHRVTYGLGGDDAEFFQLHPGTGQIRAGHGVTVAEVPVARVVMSTDSARLAVRTSLQLTAVTLSAAGDTLAGRSIEWTSSDTAIAVVSPAGKVMAVGAGAASIIASSESAKGSTDITVDPSELEVRGLYVQFERRGWPSGYWSGDVIKQFTQFDDVVGHTVAEGVSQQLDAMRGIGVNTITFELRSSDSVFILGPPVYPECNVSPHVGLEWPNPEEEHLANLVSFLDLVQSKDMRVLLRLVNTRMDDRYRAGSEMWLGSILGSIRGHPALELVLFEGDQRYLDTDGDGVEDACGHQAEPPLWFGPDGVGARYVEWAMGYALSLGLAPEKLSAEAVIGVYVIDQGPDLWFTPGVMRTIFERVGIPDGQRTYAISFYQGRRCRFADGLPCEDADPHDWTDESLLRTLHAIGLESTAGIIAPEFGAAAPIEGGWGSVEALESAVELMRKRGVRGGSLWRWTSFDDEEDADTTLWEPVKRRGPGLRVHAGRRCHAPPIHGVAIPALYRPPNPAGSDTGQGHPLHGAASPDRRSAGSGGATGLLLDRLGAENRGDAHQARASAGAPEGACCRLRGRGAGGSGLDRRLAGAGVNPDQGGPPDGAAGRCGGAGVRRLSGAPTHPGPSRRSTTPQPGALRCP